MAYGSQIGKKFHKDGSAARYPGNTVVSDATPETRAYQVMSECLTMLEETGLSELFIPLPKDSDHMTVIRGVNDLVREAEYWPEALPKDVPMTVADDYMTAAIGRVANPGAMRMRFGEAKINAEDCRISMLPADDAQEQVLRTYRDQVADAVGLRLPGHETYTFHITLAYTWQLPDETQKRVIGELKRRMDKLLAKQPVVELHPPHIAYYRDMLSFSAERIER